ncbi:MAG: hypothetical protein WA070_10380 [Sphingobium sp.]
MRQWPLQVAALFGTRVAETILASVHVRTHPQAGHMNASDPINIICQILQGGGRPHMAHHDNRTPQMGAWVMINAGWYYPLDGDKWRTLAGPLNKTLMAGSGRSGYSRSGRKWLKLVASAPKVAPKQWLICRYSHSQCSNCSGLW